MGHDPPFLRPVPVNETGCYRSTDLKESEWDPECKISVEAELLVWITHLSGCPCGPQII